MPIKLCNNLGAIKTIRWCDTPRHIINDYRECINCIHWFNINGVEGKCECKGKFANNKNLYTWYSETCCYCYLRSKYKFNYDKKLRYNFAINSQNL